MSMEPLVRFALSNDAGELFVRPSAVSAVIDIRKNSNTCRIEVFSRGGKTSKEKCGSEHLAVVLGYASEAMKALNDAAEGRT